MLLYTILGYDFYCVILFSVPLSDPTCYAPVIDYVRAMAEGMQDGQNYVVLLIITDGGIAGMKVIIYLIYLFMCDSYKKINIFFNIQKYSKIFKNSNYVSKTMFKKKQD
jgi:hypothetical protein